MKTHLPMAPLAHTRFALWHMTRWLLGLAMMTLVVMPASADPPGRVGRIAEVNGHVWIFEPESNEWIAATRNRPITSEDRISTESDGSAELRLGHTTIWVAASTGLDVLQLDDDHVDLELHSGSVAAYVRSPEAAREFRLVTLEGQFFTDQASRIRFDRIHNISRATVWQGEVKFEGERSALTVQPGQRAEFWTERALTHSTVSEPERDAFSDWVSSRSQHEVRGVSSRYVSPEMPGVEDLDRYGQWEESSEYGALWIPRKVEQDWAPYRMGHWAWVRPWGWTWVDDAPWGFAPFHYGRWVWHRNAWCWSPGRFVAKPVYAPALVAWVGGPHVNLSVSVGHPPSVGWFPLAPREVYVPGYRVSPGYVRRVNEPNVRSITSVEINHILKSPGTVVESTHYVNRRLDHAVTVVPRSIIERRQPVAPAVTHRHDPVWRGFKHERNRVQAPVVPPAPASVGVPQAPSGVRRIEVPRTGRSSWPAQPQVVAPVAPVAPSELIPAERQEGGPGVHRVPLPGSRLSTSFGNIPPSVRTPPAPAGVTSNIETDPRARMRHHGPGALLPARPSTDVPADDSAAPQLAPTRGERAIRSNPSVSEGAFPARLEAVPAPASARIHAVPLRRDAAPARESEPTRMGVTSAPAASTTVQRSAMEPAPAALRPALPPNVRMQPAQEIRPSEVKSERGGEARPEKEDRKSRDDRNSEARDARQAR